MSAVTGYFPPDQHSHPPAGAHHRTVHQRRGIGTGALVGIIVATLAVLGGIGTAVTVALRSPTAPADASPAAANGSPVTVRLGEKVQYRAGKISAAYLLTAGPALTLTPSGSRPSRGSFLALTASATVASGEVFMTDDNFVLMTADGRRFEPDVSFLFDGGLRGARAAGGQTVSGLVVWDVPPGSEVGAKVELRLSDRLRGSWQLP